jgi:hypothetical protein
MRLPESFPIDTYGLARIESFAPARASMLREIAARQHAAMSAFGGTPYVFSTYVDGESSPATTTFPLLIPPGVTRTQIGIRARGRGTLDVFTPVDTDGVRLTVSVGIAREMIRWQWAGAAGGTLPLVSRSLVLETASAETWRTIIATVTATGVELFAIATAFEHQAR